MKKRGSHRRGRRRVMPRTPPGSPPGTIVVDPDSPAPVIQVISYDRQEVVEATIDEAAAIRELLGKRALTWVNINGLGDADVIRTIGEIFNLHHLALEDVVNTHQRAKMEEYPDGVFLVARMPHLEESVRSEQLSLFLGSNYVVTFQEQPGDCFEPVRRRIREGRDRLLHADYLAYALIDAVTDSYFPVLEELGERLDALEDEITRRPSAELVGRVYGVKRDLLSLRRSIWPQRDLLNSLARDPIPLVSHHTRTYFRDCYDHAVRIIDLVETYRELASGLTELYQSTVGHRLNEVMKLLTVIATIFIPLTFIAGVYGMNFDTDVSPWNMPELGWYWGYPFAIALMLVLASAMTIFFRRRGWIG